MEPKALDGIDIYFLDRAFIAEVTKEMQRLEESYERFELEAKKAEELGKVPEKKAFSPPSLSFFSEFAKGKEKLCIYRWRQGEVTKIQFEQGKWLEKEKISITEN